MKAKIEIGPPKVLALRKDGLPRKKPFRVEGKLSIEELNAEKSDKKDRRSAVEVKDTIGKLRKDYVELAALLKEIALAKETIANLQVNEVIEV
jgi:hypothetical protein